jgi:hypothetical protein
MIGKLTWHTLLATCLVTVMAFNWQVVTSSNSVAATFANLTSVVGLGG